MKKTIFIATMFFFGFTALNAQNNEKTNTQEFNPTLHQKSNAHEVKQVNLNLDQNTKQGSTNAAQPATPATPAHKTEDGVKVQATPATPSPNASSNQNKVKVKEGQLQKQPASTPEGKSKSQGQSK